MTATTDRCMARSLVSPGYQTCDLLLVIACILSRSSARGRDREVGIRKLKSEIQFAEWHYLLVGSLDLDPSDQDCVSSLYESTSNEA